MDFDTLMKTLCQRLDLALPAPDEQGGYRLAFDDMPIRCLRLGGMLYLEAEVAEPPAPEREATAFFQDLLQRNLARLNRQAAVLSLDEDDNTIMLYRTLSLDSLDIHRFESALEEFLNQLEYWRGNASAGPASVLPGAMQMFFP